MGLNAAKLYDIDVPAEFRVAGTPGAHEVLGEASPQTT